MIMVMVVVMTVVIIMKALRLQVSTKIYPNTPATFIQHTVSISEADPLIYMPSHSFILSYT